jgi:hypothetical protein
MSSLGLAFFVMFAAQVAALCCRVFKAAASWTCSNAVVSVCESACMETFLFAGNKVRTSEKSETLEMFLASLGYRESRVPYLLFRNTNVAFKTFCATAALASSTQAAREECMTTNSGKSSTSATLFAALTALTGGRIPQYF